MKTDEAVGDCYEAAGSLVCFGRGPEALPEGAVLVHGRCTLTREPFEPFGHAWIEYDAEGIEWCLNVAGGDDAKIPAVLYYSVGRVENAETFRYTRDEAREKIREHGHWGPWEGVESEGLP